MTLDPRASAARSMYSCHSHDVGFLELEIRRASAAASLLTFRVHSGIARLILLKSVLTLLVIKGGIVRAKNHTVLLMCVLRAEGAHHL